jgi:hypothetical protein
MNLSALSLKQLENIVGLLKEKEVLQTKLDGVNRDLQRLENGNGSGLRACLESHNLARARRLVIRPIMAI